MVIGMRTVLWGCFALLGLTAGASRNVAILVDCSRQSPASLAASKDQVRQFLQTLDDTDLVSLVSYSDRARIRVFPRQLGQARRQLETAIDRLKVGNEAALFEGLSFASVAMRRHVHVYDQNLLKVFGPAKGTIGYTSEEALTRLALSLRKEGIRVEGLPLAEIDDLKIRRNPLPHPLLVEPPPVGCPFPHQDVDRRAF